MLGDGARSFARERQSAGLEADEAVAALRRAFLATPYRPASLSTAEPATVRLLDEINWVDTIVVESARAMDRGPADHAARRVRTAAAAVLEQERGCSG